MSIKDLFNKKQASFENAATGSKMVESRDFILRHDERKSTFIPNIDFNSASNFAKFGSAYEYYTKSIERIYDEYPYDGSDKEKIVFELSSSYLDKWIFDNHYPKATGYIKLSNGGWGSLNGSITADGYGLPSSIEYIYSRGGMHTASSGMEGKPLVKTFDKSIKYDSTSNRTTTFRLNIPTGLTVEFWLKKDSFDITKTKKEVILDLWNGELSSSSDYGRFTLELSGTTSGTDTFRVSLQSGTNGFFDQAIGTSTITTSSLGDWSHYAFSFVSASAGVTSRMYVNGTLNEEKTLGSTGLGEISGLINGYVGALQTSPSGSSAAQYSGKLDAYLDDFRFWKTRRTSEQIYNNYYTHVGGGTNTDDANTDLGLYYKFNEGIVGDASYDSVVLDYSGRIANGTWIGYGSGARNLGSAFVSSSTLTAEPADPIIRSVHPDVTTLVANLQTSGSEWDDQNTSLIYNRIPMWIREEDEDDNQNVKYLFQIIASYFDTLYQQISYLPRLKEKQFFEGDYKPLPFADRLLSERGLVTSNILINSDIFEQYNNRDSNKVIYERKIEEVKNLIYTNIYNNLEHIYKSKGTETSIRNMLRCFGIDDEIVKLNVYTDGGTHYFKDNYKQTVLNLNYIDFNSADRYSSTIFQTSSINNSDTFITGSKTGLNEINSAFTTEINLIVPYKVKQHEDFYIETNFLSASVFGMHEAGIDPADYTWEASEKANFQVYLVRDELESKNAKFVLTNRDGSLFLESDTIKEIYDNHMWNVAVRVKPDKYPYLGNVVNPTNPTYTVDFYGATHAYGTLSNSFHLSAALSYTSGSAFMSNPKRLYAGAHLTNFTGAVLQQTDIKIGSLAYYQDYLDNNTINQHNLDPSNYGTKNSFAAPTMFFSGSENRQNPTFDSKALLWNFATVTGSNAAGLFTVDDFTSGSTTFEYTWPDKITKSYHAGRGYGFPASNTSFINNELIYSNKKELPEISYTSDNVIIEDQEKQYFIKDDDISDNFFILEKSTYQVVSEEMLNMFSSVKEFSNLMGKAVDRYRMEYKKMNFVRSLFFEKVEQDIDFDRFTEYFKWIDDSISQFVTQLFPVSVKHSKQISDVVESHILERNKYQNKFPLLTRYPSTEGQIKGSSELRYNWKTGHAPVDSSKENENCVWQKQRKERSDITEREDLRKVIITETSASAPTFSQVGGTTYKGSAFALRKLSRPYKISQELKPPIHGGINYSPKKDRDLIYHLTQRHGAKGNYGQPLNVVAAGLGTGSLAGIIEQQKCDDVVDPNLKKRVHLDVYAGRYSNETYTPGARSEADTYAYRLSEFELPVNIISQSNNSGYNTEVVAQFNSGSIVTNIHSDTVSPTNHIPMQGPFTQTWVGGHQHRHVAINRYDTTLIDDDLGVAPPNNLDNKYTRPEAWRLALGDYINNDGALGIVGPDYGGPYPDPARKVAVFYREERAKRPVNIKNIQHTTASRNLGNYKENYEIISAGGKSQNNLQLRKNPEQSLYLPTAIGNVLPETTHPMSLFGQAPFVSGNIFGTHHNNRQPDTEELVLIEPVEGVAATGRFTIKGKEYVTDGDYVEIDESGGTFNKHRFVIQGGVNNATTSSFGTGSSDTDFWNLLTASIQTAFTGAYSTTYTTSSAVYGVATWMTGNAGGADYLSASVTNMSASEFTFSTWAYWSGSAPGSDKFLIWNHSPEGFGNSFRIRLTSAGLRVRLSFIEAGGGSGKTEDPQWRYGDYHADFANKWTHITVTYNSASSSPEPQGDNMTIYFNGVSASWTGIASRPSSLGYSAQPASITGLHLFQNPTSVNTNWVGGIDEPMWWNRQLTPKEVTTVYNCAVGHTASSTLPQGSDMAFWYGLGDNTNDDVDDGEIFYNKLDAAVNRLVSINPAGDLGLDTGIAMTGSYAVIAMTASVQSPDYNAIITTTGSCSFSTVHNIAGGVTPVVGDTRTAHDVVNSIVTSSVTSTVISSRFSAPGGIDTSPAYLDVYSREYSVHNALPFRNLSVRSSGSGESGTIRVNSQAGRREGLRTSLSRHCGKFGIDSQHGSVSSADYDAEASFHKVHRNVGRRPTDTSTIPVPVFNEDHNNAHFTSLIPRSEFQYSWVTSSLGSNYSYKSGKQRIYGYTPTDGILSSSVSIGGESGFVAAINFPTASEIFGE